MKPFGLIFAIALLAACGTTLTPERIAAIEQDAALVADTATQIYTHQVALHATPTPPAGK